MRRLDAWRALSADFLVVRSESGVAACGIRLSTSSEQRARANELLNTPEACLPWEPMPACFSGNWHVVVTHIAEDSGEEATDVT